MRARTAFAVAAGVCLAAAGLDPTTVQAGSSKGKVLIVNTGSNSVTVINAKNREVLADVPVGNHPSKLVIDPKGKFAYVINPGSDDLSIIDLDKFTVLRVPLGFEPSDLAITPNGKTLVILHDDPDQSSGGPEFKGDYSIYDVKKGELVTNQLNGVSVSGDAHVCGVVADNGGVLVYITSCAANQVVVIILNKARNDDSGDEVKAVIDTENNPIFMAITSK
jgi:YVTN family beta-propeller protein